MPTKSLVRLAFFAQQLGLKVKKTEAQVCTEVENDRERKLIVDGTIQLPDPCVLKYTKMITN